jgi:hypothetical protein
MYMQNNSILLAMEKPLHDRCLLDNIHHLAAINDCTKNYEGKKELHKQSTMLFLRPTHLVQILPIVHADAQQK